MEIDTGFEIFCCDANGKFICAALKNKFCVIYSLETGCKLKSLQLCEIITAPMMFRACYFIENTLITLAAGVRSASYLSKWSLEPEISPVNSVKVSEGSATYLKLSKTGKFAGIGSSDGYVICVDTENLKIVLQREEFDMPATCLDFNQKETIMMVGSADYAYSYIHLYSTSWLKICILGLLLSTIAYFAFKA